MRNSREKSKSLVARAVLLLGTLALAFIALAIFREIRAKKQIQAEIEKLQMEAEKINRENILTQEKIAYLESRDFQEKEAKDKLSLQNPDEKVVIINPGVIKIEKETEEDVAEIHPEIQSRENFLKWWDYFFKY